MCEWHQTCMNVRVSYYDIGRVCSGSCRWLTKWKILLRFSYQNWSASVVSFSLSLNWWSLPRMIPRQTLLVLSLVFLNQFMDTRGMLAGFVVPRLLLSFHLSWWLWDAMLSFCYLLSAGSQVWILKCEHLNPNYQYVTRTVFEINRQPPSPLPPMWMG